MNAIRWVGSPNYSPGRDGHNPNWTPGDPSSWIVLHTMVGWRAGTVSAFLSAARQASSTYGVNLDGSIDQYVREEDAPWTNGTMQGYGSNLDSITIECEDGGDYNGPRTPELYEAAAQLVADISRRRGIPLVHRGAGGGVLAHHECTGAQTACYDGLDGNRIIARAIEINAPPPVVEPPKAPVVVPPADTRPEWQKNLSKLSAELRLDLTKMVPIIQMATGAKVGDVAPGPLVIAYQTTTAGTDFWVTGYGSQHGNGLRKADVATAIVKPPDPVKPPVIPPVVVPPVVLPPIVDTTPAPPGGWQAFLDWLGALLRSLLGRPKP